MSNIKKVKLYSRYIVDGRWDILLTSIKFLFGGELPTQPTIINQIDEVFKFIGIYLDGSDLKPILKTSLDRDKVITFTLDPNNFEFNGYVSDLRITDK